MLTARFKVGTSADNAILRVQQKMREPNVLPATGTMAVSYTHLDVYKRQNEGFASAFTPLRRDFCISELSEKAKNFGSDLIAASIATLISCAINGVAKSATPKIRARADIFEIIGNAPHFCNQVF